VCQYYNRSRLNNASEKDLDWWSDQNREGYPLQKKSSKNGSDMALELKVFENGADCVNTIIESRVS
jgi:hypothetical protein